MLTVAISCSKFLEEVPLSNISPENFYTDADEAQMAVNSIYQSLKSTAITGWETKAITSDIKRAAGYNDREGLGRYKHTPNNTLIYNIWRHHYDALNRANIAIVNIPEDMEGGSMVLGEAKFLRAFLYFNLVRFFGDVPLIDKPFVSLDGLEVPRDPASEVYQLIIEDLDYAISVLPTKASTQYGRATVDAANALLAKVYLTMGSLAERDGTGDALGYFQKAVTHSKNVIDGGLYSLVDYYPDIFIRENKGNEELIFAVQFQPGPDLGGWVGAHMGIGQQPDYGGSWTSIHATDYFATLFEESDSIRRFWNVEKAKISVATDPVTGLKKGVYTSYEDPNYYPNNFSEGSALPGWPPFHIGKFRRFPVRTQGYTFREWDLDEPVIRYADVLLMYAEALNEVNGGPTTEAYWAVNEVRKRARNHNVASNAGIREDILPRNLQYEADAVPDFTGMDYQTFKDAVLDERAKELVGEVCNRYFDLVRTGLLVQKMRALNTYTNPITGNVEAGWDAGENVQEYHLLLPIPGAEIDVNSQLVQNPGYN